MLAYLKRVIKSRDFPIYSIITIAYLILSARFFYFIYKYTANILFWDQWDIVNDILHKNLIPLLFTQHSEHRIGVGLVITKILESFSKWDNRVESLTIGLIILFASFFALLLKKRLTEKLEATDVVIPFLFLGLYQWESMTWGFQIAFVLPLLFLFISLYLFTLKNSLWRNILLLILVFLSTYSSLHGIFLGGITGLFFFLGFLTEKERAKKIRNLIFSFASVLIAASYRINYTPATFLGAKNFDVIALSKYIILEISSFIGFVPSSTYANVLKLLVVSLLLLVIPTIALVSFVWLGYSALKNNLVVKYFPIFSLFIFSALFAASTAYGRLGLGYGGAASSRYTTFMIPLYLAIYLTITLLLSNHLKRLLVPFLIILFVFFSNQGAYINYVRVTERRDGLNRWKTCYLKKEDVKICNKGASYLVFPENRSEFLKLRLDELEKNKVNLFSSD